jgi:hypothetical protein
MSDEQAQNSHDESFLRGAAKAAAIGAALGAAVGAVTATAHESHDDEPAERPAEDQPAERDAAEPEPSAEGEEDAPQAQEPEADEPQGDESEAAEREAVEPEADEPEGDEPKAAEHEAAERDAASDGAAPTGLEIVRRVQEQLSRLSGRSAEAVLGFERTDDGWRATVEVVELARIPPSTDVLASYDVLLDRSGEVQQWRRTGRYVRSRAEGEGDR